MSLWSADCGKYKAGVKGIRGVGFGMLLPGEEIKYLLIGRKNGKAAERRSFLSEKTIP